MPHTPTPRPAQHSVPVDPLRPQNPLVSRSWLAGAAAFVIVGAVLLGYACYLLLFWQGQWQLIFHPSHAVTATPQSRGLVYDDVRFDATDTGELQLNGWWVPAAKDAAFSRLTVLYLHGARGSLSDTLPELEALHAAGVNVFAFDQRGYGRSVWATPSEERWQQDADAAFQYLTETRHLDPHGVVLCGSGFGAAVAAETARRHPLVPAIILIDTRPPSIALLRSDPRSRFVPLGILARDRLNPGPALAVSSTRKLFVIPAGTPEPPPYVEEAAPPKGVVRSHAPADILADSVVAAALQHFLAEVANTL